MCPLWTTVFHMVMWVYVLLDSKKIKSKLALAMNIQKSTQFFVTIDHLSALLADT